MSRKKVTKDTLAQAREILGRLREACKGNTFADLGRYMDIPQPAITRALRTGQVPDVWIYKVSYLTGVRVEWLNTGEAPQYQQEVIQEVRPIYMRLPPGPRRELAEQLDDYLASAPKEEVASLRRVIEALQTAAPDVRSHLVNQLKLLERLIEYDKEKLATRAKGGGAGHDEPKGRAASE